MAQRITTPADAFRSARIRARLSITELAARTGVAERTLRYIESGATTEPQMATARAVAEALGVDVEQLLGEAAIR